MERTGELTSQQIAALDALFTEKTLEKAADKAGVARITLYRWRQEPAFAAAYRDRRQALDESGLNRLLVLQNAAIDTLAEGLEAPKYADAIRAAVAILDSKVKLRDLVDLAEAVRQLQERAGILPQSGNGQP